jgi:hypothetical protein
VPCLQPSICTPRTWIGDPVTPHRIRIILQCIVSHLLVLIHPSTLPAYLSSDLLVSADHRMHDTIINDTNDIRTIITNNKSISPT